MEPGSKSNIRCLCVYERMAHQKLMYSRSNVVGCSTHGIVFFISPLQLSCQTKIRNFLQYNNGSTTQTLTELSAVVSFPDPERGVWERDCVSCYINGEINLGLNNCVFANFGGFKFNCGLKIVEL